MRESNGGRSIPVDWWTKFHSYIERLDATMYGEQLGNLVHRSTGSPKARLRKERCFCLRHAPAMSAALPFRNIEGRAEHGHSAYKPSSRSFAVRFEMGYASFRRSRSASDISEKCRSLDCRRGIRPTATPWATAARHFTHSRYRRVCRWMVSAQRSSS